jgi:hypothetical protein
VRSLSRLQGHGLVLLVNMSGHGIHESRLRCLLRSKNPQYIALLTATLSVETNTPILNKRTMASEFQARHIHG